MRNTTIVPNTMGSVHIGEITRLAMRLHLRQQQPGKHTPPDRAHSTDDDDAEGKQDEVPTHGRKYRIEWREQYAGESSEQNSESEGARIDDRDRHAQGGGHIAVEGGCPDHRADTRAVHSIAPCRR